MNCNRDRIPGVEYPRDIAIPDFLPSGWRAVERCYGDGSKNYGKTYVRFYSLDGKHKHVGSPQMMIKRHCEDQDIDPGSMLAEYEVVVTEKKEKEAAEREAARLSKGIRCRHREAMEKRDDAFQRFSETFGDLEGPVVSSFYGWKTRWRYLPKSGQTSILYIEPNGQEWKILRDLQAGLQSRIDSGIGGDIPKMLEDARKLADPVKCAICVSTCKQIQGIVELEGWRRESTEIRTGELREIENIRCNQNQRKKRRKMCFSFSHC